jgi:hypothetical protein
MADFKQAKLPERDTSPSTGAQMDAFVNNFKGANRQQRGGGWSLKGGGIGTATFLSATSSVNDILPALNNTYALGSPAAKWSDIEAVKINNQTPLAGTKVYYVSDSSGGTVNRKLTFINGILVSES